MVRKRQIWFKSGIIAFTLLALLCVALWQRSRPFYLMPTMAIEEGTNLYKADPDLGYSTKPGQYHVVITAPSATGNLRFKVTIGPDGNRVCQPVEAKPDQDTRKQIWMFGCSYSWGWGVDDEQALPWLLQQRFQEYRFRSFCCSGYGQTHELVSLRRALADPSNPRPLLAMFCFSQFHAERNVAAPEWIALFRGAPGFEMYQYPRSRVVNGKLQIDRVPLFQKDPNLVVNEPVTKDQMNQTTRALLSEIAKECKAHGIQPMLVLQLGDQIDPVIEHARTEGFSVADIRLDINCVKEFNLMPYDCHPSPIAHHRWADMLSPRTVAELNGLAKQNQVHRSNNDLR